jgi:hypothetical protein
MKDISTPQTAKGVAMYSVKMFLKTESYGDEIIKYWNITTPQVVLDMLLVVVVMEN